MDKIKHLLKQIDKTNLKYLGGGMQSTVFELDDRYVLKVYSEDIGISNILRLKDFYESLNTNKTSFVTPYILDIEVKNGKILVTEKKLVGECPDTPYLQKMSENDIKKYLSKYINTLFEIQNIETSFIDAFEPLDLSGKFFVYEKYMSWDRLLIDNINRKYRELEEVFISKVDNCDYIFDQIKEKIRNIKIVEYKLIHGDFFPANTMISDDYSINAVLDFGILTTIGDPVFDLALGWIFSDMYREIESLDVKAYLEPMVLERLTRDEGERFFLYILVYSSISANMYDTNDPNDGHFKWCIRNLNDKNLLSKAGII